MQKTIPNLKVDLPSYPDWKKGLKWGLIWGMGAGAVIVAGISLFPPPSPLDGKPLTMLEVVLFRVTIFAIIFIVVGFLFGILASYRPTFNRNKKIDQEKERYKRTKSIQRTEYRR